MSHTDNIRKTLSSLTLQTLHKCLQIVNEKKSILNLAISDDELIKLIQEEIQRRREHAQSTISSC